MPEQQDTTNQLGRKPFKKKRITRLSTPLPSITPTKPITDEATIRLATVHDDDETLKESLAARQTYSMPVPFHTNEAVSRDIFSEHPTNLIPASPRSTVPAPRQPSAPLQHSFFRKRWKLSHLLLVLIVLAPFIIGGGVLEAAQLKQSQNALYQIDARSGTIQWQQPSPTSTQIAYADAQGIFLIVATGHEQHQLVALNPNGLTLWKSFSSQNTITPLPAASPTGTLLIALSSQTSATNPVTGSTNAYLHPFTLSLLDRQNGHTLWQNTLVSPQQSLGAKVLGADSRYLYVALAQTRLQSYKTKSGVELVAIDPHTGHVAWHFTDHAQANVIPQDAGQLLLYKNLVVWQLAGAIYTFDAFHAGHILWRAFITEPHTAVLSLEEAQMAVAGGDLLFERSDTFHALDLQSGAIQWEISNPGLNGGNNFTVTSITAHDNIIILYDTTDIEAVNTLTQHIVWSQNQLDTIHNLHIASNGSLAFVTTTDSIEGSPPVQAFVALDMTNGTVRWTFQPSDQINFIPLSPGGIVYSPTIILTAFCLNPCAQQYLYALNPTTGATLWKYAGNTITDVYLSTNGRSIFFQRNSSAWLDLLEHFKNA